MLNINERIKLVRSELDPAKYPETCNILDIQDIADIGSYQIASELVECDKSQNMPRVLFDFIADLYREAAEAGDPDACNDLGALYYYGHGCEQDFSKAMMYYEMAAQLGSRKAQENLGYCYYYGRDVDVDYEKAFNYFSLGAFTGSLISLYKIGDMYMNGYYVKKNPVEAFRIYDTCIKLMTDESAAEAAGPVYLRLGNCFLNGTGIEANAKNALICFQKAESWLYDMVANGDSLYERSLQAAVEGQSEAREKLAAQLYGTI